MGETTFLLGGDREVHRLGLGAMRLAGPGCLGPPDDPPAARRLLRRAVELGIDLIDTADRYGPEVNESLIAEALHPYPPGLVIVTKGGLRRSGPDRAQDASPAWLRASCEGSLRRLRREPIDLYLLHAPDPEVPLEESLGALADLQAAGKIRHLGVSNVTLDELHRARAVVRVAAVQNRYSLADRKGEPVLDACARTGTAFMPWLPLGEGRLARPDGPLAGLASAQRATPAQLALAWLLQRAPVVLPIPGTASLAHLEENVAAARLEVPPELARRLEATALVASLAAVARSPRG